MIGIGIIVIGQVFVDNVWSDVFSTLMMSIVWFMVIGCIYSAHIAAGLEEVFVQNVVV
jgi:hypothetical protein